MMNHSDGDAGPEGRREEHTERLPLDARLLADAVIELNISRRSVSLYPSDHPITRGSIARAFDFLQQLFEVRGSITLGIARDVLLVDEHTLDRKNPVFREFAASLHECGIAAVTFSSGLAPEELQALHELISGKGVTPQTVVQAALDRNIRHIRITPLDLSKLAFAEGQTRQTAGDGEVWETYVGALLDGSLSGDYADGLLRSIPPEKMAAIVDGQLLAADLPDESYDRVITSYLKKRERVGIPSDLFNRFVRFVGSLSPGLKQQFLSRALGRRTLAAADMEQLLRELSAEDLDRMMQLFMGHASLVPESIRNLLDKLDTAGADDARVRGADSASLVDDIDLGGDMSALFGEDRFGAFVTDDYRADLNRMLAGPRVRSSFMTELIERECRPETVETRFSELVLELIDNAGLSRDDYLKFLTEISTLVNGFLDTGRFREISDVYNTVYTHTLTGRFRDEAKGMLEYYFDSPEFTGRFMTAVKLWGRFDREGVLRLVRVRKRRLMDPLFDALADEQAAAVRGFLLQLLSQLGSDMLAEAAKRLKDPRWYVVRNMLYLIREANGERLVQQIRPFARHEDPHVCMEAVKTLLHFGTADAVTYLRHYLRGDDHALRAQAARLAGMHRCGAVVPDLLEILQRQNLLGIDADGKTAVVWALGEIGDERAIPVLAEVCRAMTILNRAAMEALRLEIFRSLAHYPPDAAAPLVALGLRSRSEEIRSVCRLMQPEDGGGDAG